MKFADKKYVIAGPEDYKTGLDILSATILETISRIEKRQKEVLELFEQHAILDKNTVMEHLKVSAVTAAKALKTLANSGYLKENRNVKPFNYERSKTEGVLLVKTLDTSRYSAFYENELKIFLDNTLSLVSPECHEPKPEVTRPEPLRDLRHTDETNRQVPSEAVPNLSEETNVKQLVFSEKTRDNDTNAFGREAKKMKEVQEHE